MDAKRLRLLRNKFLYASIILFAVGITLQWIKTMFRPGFSHLAAPVGPVVPLGPPTPSPAPSSGLLLAYVFGGISLLSSFGTFIGFLSTAALTWRKELRESHAAKIDVSLKQAQLEKLRRELENSATK